MEIIIIPIVSVMIVVFVDWLFGLSKMKKNTPKVCYKGTPHGADIFRWCDIKCR